MSRSKRTKRKRVSKKKPRKNSSPKKRVRKVLPTRFRIFHKDGTPAIVHPNEIICLHSTANYTIVFCTRYPNEEMVANHNLKHCLSLLPPDQFLRCHHEWAINLDLIDEFVEGNKSVYMVNKHIALISDRCRPAFIKSTINL